MPSRDFSARAAPIAVSTCLTSSGGGRTFRLAGQTMTGNFTADPITGIVSGNGQIVWEGRLEDPTLFAGQDGSGLSLQALGYGPASLPDAGKCDANTDMTCFPERAACAKTDSVHCDYLWRRGEQLIRVRTVAIPPTVAAVECQVNCK